MRDKILLSLFCFVVAVLQANAQVSNDSLVKAAVKTYPKHSLGVAWSYWGFSSTYSKNTDKKTFGTFLLLYQCQFNKWIAVNGRFGWTHSWYGSDANPLYAYPKRDNAILLLAGCDVTWLHRSLVQLHSGIAAGVDIRVQCNERGTYTTWGLAGQIDAIGVRLVWPHSYIDISAGWGSIGCIALCAGYRF